MKHLKSKLLVAIAMLLFASIMMTTATYAWFTISTRPEIKDLKAQVVVNDNLEIALARSVEGTGASGSVPGPAAVGDSHSVTRLDPHNYAAYTWGNVIDLGGVDAYENLDKTLRPATLAVKDTTQPQVLDLSKTATTTHTISEVLDPDGLFDVEPGYYYANGSDIKGGLVWVKAADIETTGTGKLVYPDVTEDDPLYETKKDLRYKRLRPGFVLADNIAKTTAPAAGVVNASGNVIYDFDNKKTKDWSDDAVNFYYPTYGTDGRIMNLEENSLAYLGDGVGNIKGTDGKIYGYFVDFWLRSNVGGIVSLSEAEKRSANGQDGNGSYIKANTSDFVKTSDNALDDYNAYMALVENARVAFKVIYDEAGAVSDTQKIGTAPLNVATTACKSDKQDKFATIDTLAEVKAATDGQININLTRDLSGNVCKLTRNKAVFVRMFVYLEGKDVDNAAASLQNKIDFTNAIDLNVQFKITDDEPNTDNNVVEYSMDGQN